MFIENISDAKKMWSVWGAAALAGANAAMAFIPGLKEMVTPETYFIVNMAGGVVIAVLRVLKQNLEKSE